MSITGSLAATQTLNSVTQRINQNDLNLFNKIDILNQELSEV